MNRRQFNLTSAAVACAALAPPVTRASAAKRKIKIGQIGTAHAHASGKLASYRGMADDYEVVGVVEPDAKRRESCEGSEPYGGLKWMTEEELLNTPGLEAVAIETQVKDLVPTATRAVTAGMHVHVDKPAGESMAALRTLHAEASRQKRTVQIGYMFRYNPAFQLCFQAAKDGWLGEIFSVDAVMSKAYTKDKRETLLPYLGSAMFELGCHVIDQLVTLMGKPDRVTPYARSVRTDFDSLADDQMAVFEYPKAAATVRSTLLEVDGGSRRQFVVCGTQGTLQIIPLEPPEAMLTLTEAHGSYRKGRNTAALPKMTGRYDGEFLDLAAVIRGEKPLAWDAAHDLAVHECILRASSLPLD
ncbi:MAG TPA: Gfo/Idh/MocA family oxidoreductase [Pirellulales bacterium]|nr:Gfo/Idh/MocA family oxidoreductase [Pirellulales bacterium]